LVENKKQKIYQMVYKPGSVSIAGWRLFILDKDYPLPHATYPNIGMHFAIGYPKRVPIRSCSWRGLPCLYCYQ